MAPENDPFVTPRELHEKLTVIDDKLDVHFKDDERRFGRIEKGLVVLGVMVAAPKLGAPSATQATAFVLSLFGG